MLLIFEPSNLEYQISVPPNDCTENNAEPSKSMKPDIQTRNRWIKYCRSPLDRDRATWLQLP